MQLKSFLSFAGFVILLAATYCPLIRPLGIFNFDLYDLNKPFGLIILLISIIGIAGIILRQRSVARMSAWLGLTLVVLLFAAVVFKVNHAFNFIPFKSLAGYLTRHIKFKWGWFLLFAGPILAIIGISGERKSIQPVQ